MTTDSWKIEFEKKFGIKLVKWCEYGGEDWREYHRCVIKQQGIDEFTLNNIESFISQLISSVLQKERERAVEEIKRDVICDDYSDDCERCKIGMKVLAIINSK